MKQIIGEKNILDLLYEFDEVFPHNKEKIEDYVGWAKKINDLATVIVIEQNKSVVGMSVFYDNNIEEKKGYISLIGLKKQYRRMGLGKSILDSVIAEMKSRGMLRVYLEVDNDNLEAIAFYSKYGFVIDQNREFTKLLKYEI